DADAGEPARGEGDRRVGHDRLDVCGAQRRDRRAHAARRDRRRDADDAAARLAGDRGRAARQRRRGARGVLSSQDAERRIEEALGRLDLERKVRLLTGAGQWRTHAEPLIGLRAMLLSDGPAGVRGERWDERHTSANLPSPTALAASFDERLVERLGGLLAAEARRKEVDVLLAPGVNLHRSPLGGRNFEYFSEDPVLAGRIGAAYVRGVQAGGVAATVKHYVA